MKKYKFKTVPFEEVGGMEAAEKIRVGDPAVRGSDALDTMWGAARSHTDRAAALLR